MRETSISANLTPAHPTPVLVVEDEQEIIKFLRLTLESYGFKPIIAKNAQEGLRALTITHPEVIILDLGLPDMDGLQLIQKVREWSETPIIVLSAREHEKDKVAALEAGADDYLTKPFSTVELLARLKVALRHARHLTSSGNKIFESNGLKVDLAARVVTLHDQEIHLTPAEYKLLSMLIKHAGKVVTHTQLLKEIWQRSTPENNNYLRIHAQHLRQKLKDDPISPTYIITEPGIGYRFKTADYIRIVAEQ